MNVAPHLVLRQRRAMNSQPLLIRKQLMPLLLAAGLASVALSIGGGCCGGRLVSVQLYESDQPASDACSPGHIPSLRILGHHGGLLPGDPHAFRGPAATTPIPRFHPVPTQPVFEPPVEHAPLRFLPGDGAITPEPTPARPPAGDPPA
jgi:hypothetical protein